MTDPLFDPYLRALRRDRAARLSPILFLHQRAYDDCLDRLGDIRRSFSSALLLGCPDPAWRSRLEERVAAVTIIDPGYLFAAAARGAPGTEALIAVPLESFDLCISIGLLDTAPDLPLALARIRASLQPDGLLLGAIAGGASFPALRTAMSAADRKRGAASAHIHPQIEAASLAPLLDRAGFRMPVVDVDRLTVRYRDFDRLVFDLRRMGATNILHRRDRTPLSRSALAAARTAFQRLGDGQNTAERFDILHFAAWTPPCNLDADQARRVP